MTMRLDAFYRTGAMAAEDEYIRVSNCGYYQDLVEEKGTNRPDGRCDWQLIYILSGRMACVIDGKETEFSSGDVLLYPPFMPQIYRSTKGTRLSYAWIHFSGTGVRKILSDVGFGGMFSYHVGVTMDVVPMIYTLTQELRHAWAGAALKTTSIFLDILVTIARQMSGKTESPDYVKIAPALRDMEDNVISEKSVADYAKMCGFDKGYFIHLFKKVVGVSPMHYISDIVMYRAAGWLLETERDIAFIAHALGFRDPCYFSRRFHQRYGMSPSAYRRKYRKKSDGKKQKSSGKG